LSAKVAAPSTRSTADLIVIFAIDIPYGAR
jgi:hypothetical protein